MQASSQGCLARTSLDRAAVAWTQATHIPSSCIFSYQPAAWKRGFENDAASRIRGNLAARASRSAAVEELQTRSVEADSAPVATKLEWQSPLRIIKYPDPQLRAVNARVGVFDDALRQLSKELLEALYNGDDGVGLAAPQVGVNIRLMVFNPTGKRGDKEYVLVNPQIIKSNKTQDVFEEGCLSFPQIFADVERPTMVEIKAQDLKGAKFKVKLMNWQARIFQHEYDHLQGVLFHDRMKPEVLARIKPSLQALERQFKKQQPDVQIQTVD